MDSKLTTVPEMEDDMEKPVMEVQDAGRTEIPTAEETETVAGLLEESNSESTDDMEMEQTVNQSVETEIDSDIGTAVDLAVDQVVPEEKKKPVKRATKKKETAKELAEELTEEDIMQAAQTAAQAAAQTAAQQVIDSLSEIYTKRRVFRATDAERREMYEKERIITARGDRAVTEKDRMKQEYDVLMNAARAVPKQILYGQIVGVCEIEGGMLCAVARLDDTMGYYKILIPAIELFQLNLTDYQCPEGMRYLTNEMNSRIGSHICFVIYRLDEKQRQAYASRVEAMSMESYRWYRKIRNDGVPEICEGMLVKAEVMSVRKDRVKVYVLGAETTIQTKEMSWLSLGVLTDEFRVGETFNVKVTNIRETEYVANGHKIKLINITASKRDAEPNPAEMYYDTFNIGESSMGIIKNITEKGIYVNLQGKMDCLCMHTASGVPAKNLPCVVQITEKKDENRFIYGKIIHMG